MIVTYRRPSYLRVCLEHLYAQTEAPGVIAVVDASKDSETKRVVDNFPGAVYLRNERGPGATATSRAIGFRSTTAPIVAFVDDDAYAHPDWLEGLLKPYADQTVGIVGGRTLRGIAGEETIEGPVGKLLSDGTLSGYFATDTLHDIDVDHVLGANMSVRRAAVEAVGGIRDFYPGTCICEETDICLRVGSAGYRIIYTPVAIVDHVAGPYARGQRFDARWRYYAARNHVVLLASTLGFRSAYFRAFISHLLQSAVTEMLESVTAFGDQSRGTIRQKLRGAAAGPYHGAIRAAGLGAGLLAASRIRV